MTHSSDSMDNLTSDIRHLSTLIGAITNTALNDISPALEPREVTERAVNDLCDLLWIARDMVEQITENSEACHAKVIADRRAQNDGAA